MAYQGLQGGGSSFLQTGSSSLQGGDKQRYGGSLTVQPANGAGASLNQSGPAVSSIGARPVAYVDTSSAIDPAQAAAEAKAAADAAKAAKLRGQITDIVNTIKGIFDSRYGNIDAAAAEQSANLNSRFNAESQDLTKQTGDETNLAGAAAAAGGTYDSSYRANNQDLITHAGQSQIRDLGQELKDNLAKIGQYVLGQKQEYKAEENGMDAVLSRLAESTDPDELTSLRNKFDSRIAELRAGDAKNATQAKSLQALSSIAPSSARAVQLKTTLAKIVGGNAPAAQKAAVGQALISNAGLDPEDQQKLLLAFNSDLSSTNTDDKQQTA